MGGLWEGPKGLPGALGGFVGGTAERGGCVENPQERKCGWKVVARSGTGAHWRL